MGFFIKSVTICTFWIALLAGFSGCGGSSPVWVDTHRPTVSPLSEPDELDAHAPLKPGEAMRMLGLASVAILNGAKRVEAFSIQGEHARKRKNGATTVPDGLERIEGYVVTGHGTDQDEKFVQRLKSVLFDDSAHIRVVTFCFEPGVVLRAWKGSDSITIAICFHCDNLHVYATDASGAKQEVSLNFNAKGRQLLLRLAREALPEDQEIQKLAENGAD